MSPAEKAPYVALAEAGKAALDRDENGEMSGEETKQTSVNAKKENKGSMFDSDDEELMAMDLD